MASVVAAVSAAAPVPASRRSRRRLITSSSRAAAIEDPMFAQAAATTVSTPSAAWVTRAASRSSAALTRSRLASRYQRCPLRANRCISASISSGRASAAILMSSTSEGSWRASSGATSHSTATPTTP